MAERTVRIQGREIPYRIRKSAKVTRVSLRIGQSSGLELVVPPDIELLNPDQVLRGKASWILRKLDLILIAKMCPPYQEAERWISEHGMRLSIYS